ncbi:MAG: FtsX-like permease family protein [Acidobacteriota bacterium]|nr:ABC transporter permease [Blastocatellia bacterium]MDW8412339.1 FtsX-like permease family protein [Acidobacteriota bacterium]
MEYELILANITQRPMRTFISIVGVALGVVLVVVVVGLSRGMLKEQGRRNSNFGAEIIFRRPGALSFTSTSGLSMPVQYGPKLAQIEGVSMVSPLGQYLKQSSQGFGVELVDGIDFPTYVRVSSIRIVEGGPFETEMDVIVDRVYSRNKNVVVGSKVEIFGRQFRVVGIYEPEVGARIKMQLDTMQRLLGAKERCSYFYVKCVDPALQEEVAKRINAQLPGNQIIFVRDIPVLYERGSKALNTFLQVVIAVALIVSTLVILLSMYTTIIERTREIGILKSLGASRSFIVRTIQQEAILISILGVLLGYLLAVAVREVVMQYTALIVDIELKWMLYAGLIGIISGFLGSLYPALRAAAQDPIKAISYE